MNPNQRLIRTMVIEHVMRRHSTLLIDCLECRAKLLAGELLEAMK